MSCWRTTREQRKKRERESGANRYRETEEEEGDKQDANRKTRRSNQERKVTRRSVCERVQLYSRKHVEYSSTRVVYSRINCLLSFPHRDTDVFSTHTNTHTHVSIHRLLSTIYTVPFRRNVLA